MNLHTYLDDVMYDKSPQASVLEHHLGIALERLDDAETGLQDIGASIRELRDEYKTNIDEIKVMLSVVLKRFVMSKRTSTMHMA
jgi:hypothetical protein